MELVELGHHLVEAVGARIECIGAPAEAVRALWAGGRALMAATAGAQAASAACTQVASCTVSGFDQENLPVKMAAQNSAMAMKAAAPSTSQSRWWREERSGSSPEGGTSSGSMVRIAPACQPARVSHPGWSWPNGWTDRPPRRA